MNIVWETIIAIDIGTEKTRKLSGEGKMLMQNQEQFMELINLREIIKLILRLFLNLGS